jgi:hypothetical protein
LAGLVYPERAVQLLAIQIAVPRIAVLPNAVFRIAVIRDVVLIVVPILALNAVLIVAVIQALIPDRDVHNADSHEELREEFHRGLAVAEAQAVLQRHLVEFLRWSQEQQELLLVLLAPLRLVDSLRAFSVRVRERLLTF